MATCCADAHNFPSLFITEGSKLKRKSFKKVKKYETDEHRLAQRAKQIQYGENTPGYHNLLKALALYPELLKGCIPVKPSAFQKCSKRSWDGQVRKWRRALHMYDYIDFEDDEQVGKFVHEKLIEQNKNPLFHDKLPLDTPSNSGELPFPSTSNPIPATQGIQQSDMPHVRVRYSFEDLLRCAESNLLAPSIPLPQSLQWLDKRVDLEDDVAEVDSDDGSPSWTPFSPGYISDLAPVSPLKPWDSGATLSSSQGALSPVQLFPDSPNAVQQGQIPSHWVTTSSPQFPEFLIDTSVLDKGTRWDHHCHFVADKLGGTVPRNVVGTKIEGLPLQAQCKSQIFNPLMDLEMGLQRLCL